MPLLKLRRKRERIVAVVRKCRGGVASGGASDSGFWYSVSNVSQPSGVSRACIVSQSVCPNGARLAIAANS